MDFDSTDGLSINSISCEAIYLADMSQACKSFFQMTSEYIDDRNTFCGVLLPPMHKKQVILARIS